MPHTHIVTDAMCSIRNLRRGLLCSLNAFLATEAIVTDYTDAHTQTPNGAWAASADFGVSSGSPGS